MRNVDYPKRHLGSIDANVVLIMLANFNKTLDELESDFDRWMYALKDERMSSGKTKIEPFKPISDIGKTVSNSDALRQFYSQLHTRNIGKDVLIDYEKQINEINDRLNRVFIDGKNEGEQIGIAKGKAEVALKMLAKKFDDETIMECSGLTIEELTELKKSE
jgi:predicted transposase/invertase (TIGR01784 family)